MEANVYKCKYKGIESKKKYISPPFYNLAYKRYTYNVELDNNILKIMSINKYKEIKISDISKIEIGVASVVIPKGSMRIASNYFIDMHVFTNNSRVVILEFSEYSKVITFANELRKLGVKIFDTMNLLDMIKQNDDLQIREQILNNLKTLVNERANDSTLIEQNRLANRYIRF